MQAYDGGRVFPGIPGYRREALAGNPKLHVSSEGRGGTVRFESQRTRFGMWWEFAGGNALAVIGIPSVADWESHTRLPLEQRAATLRFIGEQVVALQTSGSGSFCYDDQTMTIFA